MTFAFSGIAALALAACGGGEESAAGQVELANGMTVAEQIDARQKGYKSIGGAFKKVREELKKDDPDMATLQTAAATLSERAAEMDGWFPEGTGPDSGVETEALATIWEDPEGFDAAIARFRTATSDFQTAVAAGDMETVSGAPKMLGSSCKNCHDDYRLDD